jgi:hypothetical protein
MECPNCRLRAESLDIRCRGLELRTLARQQFADLKTTQPCSWLSRLSCLRITKLALSPRGGGQINITPFFRTSSGADRHWGHRSSLQPSTFTPTLSCRQSTNPNHQNLKKLSIFEQVDWRISVFQDSVVEPNQRQAKLRHNGIFVITSQESWVSEKGTRRNSNPSEDVNGPVLRDSSEAGLEELSDRGEQNCC